MLLAALLTYSPEDPNFIFTKEAEIKNILGFNGSVVSDIFFQSIGLTSILIAVTIFITGINVVRNKKTIAGVSRKECLQLDHLDDRKLIFSGS